MPTKTQRIVPLVVIYFSSLIVIVKSNLTIRLNSRKCSFLREILAKFQVKLSRMTSHQENDMDRCYSVGVWISYLQFLIIMCTVNICTRFALLPINWVAGAYASAYFITILVIKYTTKIVGLRFTHPHIKKFSTPTM